MHAVDLMPLASKNVHSEPLLLHTEKRFLLLFVHYLFLDNVVFHALRFFDIFFVRLQDGVHFWSQTHAHTLLWEFRHIRLSFCLRLFCWCLSGVDAPPGSRLCHTVLLRYAISFVFISLVLTKVFHVTSINIH